MPASDPASPLASPWILAGIAVLAVLLVAVLLREVRQIPARLLVLMATAFLDMAGMLIVSPLLPFYVTRFADQGVTVAGVPLGLGTLSSIVMSSFTIAQLLSAPLWGRVSDRCGRRPALLVALASSAIGYLVFALADSLLLLIVSRVVQGAGGGTVGVIQAYVADSTPPEQRARALGWLSAATNLGVALGPVLGGIAIAAGRRDLWPGDGELHLGAAAPGLLAMGLCLSAMAFAWRWLQESRERPAAGAATAGAEPRTAPRAALATLLRRPGEPATRLIWIYAIAIGGFQGVFSVLALFLDARFGIGEATIGYVFTWIGSASVFTRVLLLGRLVDRLGEARLSRVGIVVLAAGLAGITVADSLPALAVAVTLLPLGTAFTFPCVTALLSRVIAAGDRGLWLGLQHTFGGIARVSAPLLYGWCFDQLGKPVPFWIGAGLVLSTLPLGFGLGVHARRAGPQR